MLNKLQVANIYLMAIRWNPFDQIEEKRFTNDNEYTRLVT